MPGRKKVTYLEQYTKQQLSEILESPGTKEYDTFIQTCYDLAIYFSTQMMGKYPSVGYEDVANDCLFWLHKSYKAFDDQIGTFYSWYRQLIRHRTLRFMLNNDWKKVGIPVAEVTTGSLCRSRRSQLRTFRQLSPAPSDDSVSWEVDMQDLFLAIRKRLGWTDDSRNAKIIDLRLQRYTYSEIAKICESLSWPISYEGVRAVVQEFNNEVIFYLKEHEC